MKGDLAGAEVEYRAAIELDPNSPIPRKDLALVRRIGPLLPRFDDVVAGRAAPASPSEAVNFALLCAERFRGQYTAAARLFVRAFADDPRQAEDLALSDELRASHRYYAACAAVMAGAGRGADAPADAAKRGALRRQALDWLRADLAAWAAKAACDDPAERAKAAAALDLWLGDSQEIGVGPGKAPDGLPADEQSAWDALWTDVRATLERARKPVPAPPPAPKSGTAPPGRSNDRQLRDRLAFADHIDWARIPGDCQPAGTGSLEVESRPGECPGPSRGHRRSRGNPAS
jgi:hypothetical protein